MQMRQLSKRRSDAENHGIHLDSTATDGLARLSLIQNKKKRLKSAVQSEKLYLSSCDTSPKPSVFWVGNLQYFEPFQAVPDSQAANDLDEERDCWPFSFFFWMISLQIDLI